ncbi:hypothetical protein KDM41_09540 [bacterium]|nr:hypothetical protein [bacterium]
MFRLRPLLVPVLVAVGLAAAGDACAQSYYQKETTLAAELFGTGGELSLQFEKILGEKFMFRTGIGLTGVAFRKGYTVPFGVSALLGKGRNFIEIGGGGTWIDFDNNGDPADEVIFDLKEDQVVGHGVVGYRFIGDYGFTYRLAFTPAFTKEGFKPMGGAVFGYSF